MLHGVSYTKLFINIYISARKRYDEVKVNELARNLDQVNLTKKQISETTYGRGAVTKMKDMVHTAVYEYANSEVHVAVTGIAGCGKSSLINTLRSLRARDEGAAIVGTRETTVELNPYPFPQNPDIVLWDLPGIGTDNFKEASYIEKVGLTRYQALIICTSSRFREVDIWLAKQARRNNVIFYIVRTKMDNDLQNTLRDSCDPDMELAIERDLLQNLRQDISQQLQQHDLPTKRIYVLSNRLEDQHKWDFPCLTEELAKNTPEKNKHEFHKVMATCSMRIIMTKKNELQNRIDGIAKEAANAPPTQYQKIIRDVILQYKIWFDLTEEHLMRSEIKIDQLDARIQNMYKDLNELLERKIPLCTKFRDKYKKVPLVGKAFGKKKDNTRTMLQERAHYACLTRQRDLVRMQAPLTIENDTISLLEDLLDICVEMAEGILNPKQIR